MNYALLALAIAAMTTLSIVAEREEPKPMTVTQAQVDRFKAQLTGDTAELDKLPMAIPAKKHAYTEQERAYWIARIWLPEGK